MPKKQLWNLEKLKSFGSLVSYIALFTKIHIHKKIVKYNYINTIIRRTASKIVQGNFLQLYMFIKYRLKIL